MLIRNITFILLGLLSLALFAGGSIDPNSNKMKILLSSSPIVQKLLDDGIELISCDGIRLGRQWQYLAGERIGPYQCDAKLFKQEFVITLYAEATFYDFSGDEIISDLESNAVTFSEKLINFEINL